MKTLGIVLLMCIGFASCTQNERAKSWGGTMTIDLPAHEKLVNATWKEDHVWTLSKHMTANDVAETYTFHEKSSYGIAEGTVVIIETK